jgi:hypothetical protein
VSLKAEKQDEKLMENMEVNDVTNSKPYQVGNSKLMMVINDVSSPKLYQAGDNSPLYKSDYVAEYRNLCNELSLFKLNCLVVHSYWWH